MRTSSWRRRVLSGGILVLVVGLAGSAVADPSPNPGEVLRGSLVWNGDFDVADHAGHPLGWSVEGAESEANVVNLQDYRTSGLTSLQIDDKAGSNVSVRSERVPALAGVRYTASAKVTTASGTPASLYLEFWGIERDGPRLSEAHTIPSASSDWQDATVSAVAPEGTVQVTMLVYGTLSGAGTSYWDEAKLTAEPGPYDENVGPGRELFVDDYRIAELSDVDRVVHQGTKDERPLIVADKPWEKTVYYNDLVTLPDGHYQLYYTCYNDVGTKYHKCLAESTDLTHWTKPNLGLVDFNGSKDNNIVLDGNGSITYNPDADGDRYKMLTFKTGSSPPVYIGFTSPDGKHWSPINDGAALIPGGDVVNVMYDAPTKRYVATYKDRLFTSRTPGTYDRSAFITTSTDFVHWTPRVLALSGDVGDDGWAESYGGVEGQVYGMPVVHYGNQYLGLPWFFLLTDFTRGEFKNAADGPVIPSITASRDLLRWDRSSRGPLIAPGKPGAWNDGTIYTGNALVVKGDQVQLLYGGFNTWHGGAIEGGPSRKVQNASIGRAVWRRDGFVSLSNGAQPGLGDPGTVTTKPLRPGADQLYVNADVQGELKVELLDADTGQPIPGYTAADAVPIKGDRMSARAEWKGGATLPSGRIVVRFHLTGGDLYSFWFA